MTNEDYLDKLKEGEALVKEWALGGFIPDRSKLVSIAVFVHTAMGKSPITFDTDGALWEALCAAWNMGHLQ